MDVFAYARRRFDANLRRPYGTMAKAWAEALHVPLAHADADAQVDDECDHRETLRLMGQRIGALDRRG